VGGATRRRGVRGSLPLCERTGAGCAPNKERVRTVGATPSGPLDQLRRSWPDEEVFRRWWARVRLRSARRPAHCRAGAATSRPGRRVRCVDPLTPMESIIGDGAELRDDPARSAPNSHQPSPTCPEAWSGS
jgi:hypothetical protein